MEKQEKPGRVIILGGRSLMALVAAHSLASRGIEVIGSDCVHLTVLSFSRFVHQYDTYINDQESPEGFLESLLELVKRHRPEDDRPYLLMPTYRETLLVSKHKERFSPYVTVCCPDYSTLGRVHPKQNLAETAKAFGVAIPKTFCPSTVEEALGQVKQLSFPMLIKPYDGVGGRGISKINDLDTLKERLEEMQSQGQPLPLLQEMIEGEDYCFTGIFSEGILRAAMAYKNLKQFPKSSGLGVMRETIDHTVFVSQVTQLMQPLGWNGIAQIDFRWNGQQQTPAKLIEVNPRFWAGLYHSVASGIDYPWLLYQLFAWGNITEEPAAHIGSRTKTPGLWLLSALGDGIAESSWEPFLEKGKAALKQVGEGKFKQALTSIGLAFREETPVANWKHHLQKLFQEAETIESENYLKDDPKVLFGIGCGLTYLSKYGKLPPEWIM